MTKRKIKGILFDLDGVLIDTEGIYTQFWEEIDNRYPTGVKNFAQVIKGSNLHNILLSYFPCDEQRSQVSDLLNNLQRNMRYTYFSGALELLENLRTKNFACCLVTSSDRSKMASLYAQHPDFTSHFDAIITGEMVSAPKPSPECFLLGAKALDINIKDCVVIEDSINGLKAGMASGARVIGLATTCTREAIAPHCHHIASDISEISTKTILEL